jgi:hypothetical protein
VLLFSDAFRPAQRFFLPGFGLADQSGGLYGSLTDPAGFVGAAG